MKKLFLTLILFLLAISFAGCSRTKTGNYELYYNDEFIGTTHKIVINGDMICVVNPSETDNWFQYSCWDKEKIDYIKVEED